MRTMLKACMDVEAANEALRDGSMQRTMDAVIELIHPEATYFTTENGKRTCYMFFQLNDPSQIPQIAEPFFNVFRAEVDLKPVMNREDLARGLQATSLKKAA